VTRKVVVWAGVGLAVVMASGRLTAQKVPGGIAVAVVPRADTVARPSYVPPLERTVSVHFVRVSLRDAVEAIAREAHVHLTYSLRLLPAEKRVSADAERLTVADALRVVLFDTDLAAMPAPASADGIALVSRAERARSEQTRRLQGGGTIAGRVVDASTRAPLDQVAVRVEGPGPGAVTTSDGRYAIRTVPPGTYRVTARRVGYTPLTKSVPVASDSMTVADFALAAAPTRLNEMVTTAVGDQRRYEVGTVISTINADSIAPTAPITSLTDLISARAPGVEILETSGMAGAGEAIRIRGLTSLVLQNDPILIVDGVRQDNSAGGDVGAYFSTTFGGANGSHPAPTRLNDINFSDIESIDILKGPSASTEYGTDAANGVIVIMTKHGTAGRPQWRASAEQTASGVPVSFPNGYYSWGHTVDGTHTTVNCPLVTGPFAPISHGYASTVGNCAVDSVTQWNPLNHATTTIFGTGSRGKYDLTVSGGSGALRYYVSGGLSNETGAIQMPPVFRTLADTAKVGLPSSAFRSNSEQQRSVRATTAIQLGPTADLTATGSYLSTYQQTPEVAGLYYGTFLAPALSDPAHHYGYEFLGSSSTTTPLGSLSALGSQNTDRVTGGLTTNWRPAAWLVGHMTAGIDHGSQRNEVLNYPLANAAFQSQPPFLGLADATTDVYSMDLRGTATALLLRGIRAVTSAGLQMVDARTVGQSASITGITATNLTLNGATGAVVAQLANRQATLGGYGEEELDVADRLFLTGAVRIDAGSGFGRAYAAALYPKASVSWLAFDAGQTTLRVRGAFGESGVQPTNGAATTLYTPSVAYSGGTNVTTYAFNWPGNKNLRPERTTELEGGVDVGGWGNRVSLELTGYAKTTQDALVNVDLGQTLGSYTYQENIGEVRNMGLEGSATVGVVRSRPVTWDIAVNGSVNRNTLRSLAPGVTAQVVNAGNVNYRQAQGYPLYGIWAPRLTYVDANHDGIIEPNEVTVADSATYVGASLPTKEVSASTHVGLWRGAVTAGALVDYRGGYRIANTVALYSDFVGRAREENDPRAPLWLQARAVENAAFHVNALDAEDGSFVRIREVSLTYAVPRTVVRMVRVQSATVTGAVRNLALWTRYTGVDPEVSNSGGANLQFTPTAGSYAVNNNARQDFGATPLLRYWVVRVNLGW
jgi:TonB-linked SusC/RagA family outer membrane protein